MRAVWWRELRELLVPALALLVAMAVIGDELPRHGLRHESLTGLGVVGAGFGLFQGLLDRARRNDGFLLHRPLSALAIHGARSLAGVTVAVAGAAAAAAAAYLAIWREARHLARARELFRSQPQFWPRIPMDWGASYSHYGAVVVDAWGAVFALGLVLAGWAVARFAASRPRIPVAVVVAGALTIGGWSLIARCPSVSLAAAVALSLAVVVASLSLLDLAGDRR